LTKEYIEQILDKQRTISTTKQTIHIKSVTTAFVHLCHLLPPLNLES